MAAGVIVHPRDGRQRRAPRRELRQDVTVDTRLFGRDHNANERVVDLCPDVFDHKLLLGHRIDVLEIVREGVDRHVLFDAEHGCPAIREEDDLSGTQGQIAGILDVPATRTAA